MITLIRFEHPEAGEIWVNPAHVCAVSGTGDKLGRFTSIHMVNQDVWVVKGSLDKITDLLTP